MGSIPPELGLDVKPTYIPKTISEFLGEVSMIGNLSERLMKFDDFIKRLEAEMKKIDAFKRELPLCMILLNDVIVTVKEEYMQCRNLKSNVEPVITEFIPLKKSCDEDDEREEIRKEKDSSDKKNWMSSVQLWNNGDFPNLNFSDNKKQNLPVEIKKKTEQDNRPEIDDSYQSCKNRTVGRAFMPFKVDSDFPVTSPVMTTRREEKLKLPVSGLSLVTPGIKNLREELVSGCLSSKSSGSRGSSSSTPNNQSNLQTRLQTQHRQQQQSARKQRRCWSPELHRRFVNALQQLGGSQAATPKQIRDLMQVDGLTNDEVKSHLQKYRLHTRRLPSTTTTTNSANQSVSVLGGLWMHQDQYGESSKQSNSQSGSPQGPLQLTRTTGGTSTAESVSMEDEEDEEASESHSWKSRTHRSRKDDV